MLGRVYEQSEFEDLCFDFGVELDDVTSEKAEIEKETGKDSNASDEVIYKIEVPANRYDLLCLEGISKAFKIFLEKDKAPEYIITPQQLSLTVSKAVSEIRPHVVCAILRNIKFNATSYKSFIDLQEKLHQNICRQRTLVSIGTHDLDKIQPPFIYTARALLS